MGRIKQVRPIKFFKRYKEEKTMKEDIKDSGSYEGKCHICGSIIEKEQELCFECLRTFEHIKNISNRIIERYFHNVKE